MKKKNTSAKKLVITPAKRFELPDFKEIFEYRSLLFYLIRRDLKLRFQQTFIGVLWIVIQPLVQMLIFYFILGILIRVPTGNVPYHIYFLTAFIIWQFFSQIVNLSSFSLVSNIGLITKTYFPRLILPLSSVIGSMVDFVVSFVLLMIFLLFNGGFPITTKYLLIPILLFITTIFGSGVGLLFGALMVVFRDMKNLLNFILMIWMYMTPIIYPVTLVPEKFRIFMYINPLTGIVEAFRWVFLSEGSIPEVSYLVLSTAVAMVIWLLGSVAFKSMENKIADVM